MVKLKDSGRGCLRFVSWQNWLRMTLLAALVVGWGDLTSAQPAATTDSAGAPEGEGAESVECLLPADIDRFGRQLTIIGARQKIETSRADCEARGGEEMDGRGPDTESSESGR